MRLWFSITVLLIVAVLTTETFGKKTRSKEVESSKNVQEKRAKSTDAVHHKTKEGNSKEGKQLKEHGKSKKRKGSPSEESNFETHFDGPKDSSKSHQAAKSKNKRTKQEDGMHANHVNEEGAIHEKVRHGKDKYKNTELNSKSKSDKRRSGEVSEERTEESRNVASDTSSKKSKEGKNKKKKKTTLKVLEKNTEKLTNGGDVNTENNRNRKKAKSSKSSRDIDGTVNEKSKKSKQDKKKKTKTRVAKNEEESLLEKVGEKNVKDSNVPADAEEIKEEPAKISKTSKTREEKKEKERKKRHVATQVEEELKEESLVEEETQVEDREEQTMEQEEDECDQSETLQEDNESCVRKEKVVEEDNSEPADGSS